MKVATAAFLAFTTCLYAQDKVSVSLNNHSYSASGGFDREELVTVEVRKGFSKDPLSSEEKIRALEQKITFYRLMARYKVDLGKEVDAVYRDKPLASVLNELLPGVPVIFQGVDKAVTIESMAIAKTTLEEILKYLDAAAGVYFEFTEQGITILGKPAT